MRNHRNFFGSESQPKFPPNFIVSNFLPIFRPSLVKEKENRPRGRSLFIFLFGIQFLLDRRKGRFGDDVLHFASVVFGGLLVHADA